MSGSIVVPKITDDPVDNIEGLYSQADFYEKVQQVLRTSADRWYMLSFAIEDFPLISELYGRDIAKDILYRTATMLMTHRSESTVVGRVKRDEFSALVRSDRFNELEIREILQEFQETSSPNHIFLHVGIYEIKDPSASAVAICNRASIALDHIAEEKGNTFAYYSESQTDHAGLKRKVIREVEDALDKEHFQIFLQPLLDRQGTLVGAESLVRWNHPEDGIIPPGRFVGILEDAGLIYLIDRYVWELAASQLEAWKGTAHNDLFITVNISQKDFYYLDIYTIFTDLVQQYRIDPSRLRLEITEDAFVIGANRHMIDRLKAQGFMVAIDKFGSGSSSLKLLKDVSIDAIKIDTELVRESDERRRSRILLEAVIRMCKQLDMIVVAEGIETPAQLDHLMEQGVDAFQGYYFDKPMTVLDFEDKYFRD
ncbi:MAG: EAL domain-containing protein [Lachnospiraceae bacterium]|nr:EAL domain-containing protein [Lachnospiraceae bacterium]